MSKALIEKLTNELTLNGEVSLNGYKITTYSDYYLIEDPNGVQLNTISASYKPYVPVLHVLRYYCPDQLTQKVIDSITHC